MQRRQPCWLFSNLIMFKLATEVCISLFGVLLSGGGIKPEDFKCSVQMLSRVWLFVIQRTAAFQASLSFANSQSLLKLMSIDSVIPSNHHILCHPLLLLPSVFPSISVFSNDSVLLIRWPKYWHLSFSIRHPNEYSGLSSFRIDRFDLLVWSSSFLELRDWHRQVLKEVMVLLKIFNLRVNLISPGFLLCPWTRDRGFLISCEIGFFSKLLHHENTFSYLI